ncbi:MAG: hypothetical protein RL088_541 [Verrucomicrobiota bacterium]|jgi:hypothetical protein
MKQNCKWCGEEYVAPLRATGIPFLGVLLNFGRVIDSRASRASLPGYCSKKCQIEDLGRENSDYHEQRMKSRISRKNIVEVIVILSFIGFFWMNAANKSGLPSAQSSPVNGNPHQKPSVSGSSAKGIQIQTVPSLEEQESEIRAWQQQLQQRKNRLQNGDAESRKEFEEELQRYLLQLEKVKAARATEERATRR